MSKTQEQPPKTFRYQAQMDQLVGPCPPDDFEARETIAFRWVFEDMGDERNFLPQFFKKPGRFMQKLDTEKCTAMGLSFFDSQDHAQSQFELLKRRFKQDVWQMGSHISAGTLQKDDGISNHPNRNGHFTFHPFENTALKNHFSTIAPL